MVQKYHQYSSAVPYFQDAAEPGIPELDQFRLQSYGLYEQFYWNHPESYRLLQRGEDEAPLYLPTPKQIVEATNRFLAKNFDFTVGKETGTENDQSMLDQTIRDFLKRERFWPKFNAQRRYGLVRGDAVWHITADDTKPELTRISLHALHPSRYFAITDPNDPEHVIGAHLVDVVPDPKDDTKQLARRQTYRKTETGAVTSECALFQIGKWDDRFLKPNDIKQEAVITPVTELPPAITAIPVYHIPSDWSAGQVFGSSLLRGIETIAAAVNQVASDTALGWAIATLGSYWTNASPPLDPATGLATAWEIGPLRMTEVPMDRTVGRLEGIGSVQPAVDLMDYITASGMRGAGVPDIAAGKVDVAVAESGISLKLQLAPILAANEEREAEMLGVYDQMFFDLVTMWFPTYESITSDTRVVTVVDDPLPKNREAEIKEIVDLMTAKVISTEEARAKLIELGGWDIEASAEGVLAEVAATAAASDPFGQRVNNELNQDPSAQPAPQEAPVG